jgi:uncharacterized protein YigA (DUF484 family)
MRAEDVAQYLRDNPEFFESYSDMLSQISIPHPQGGRAIPIVERQVLTLRDKNRVLEAKLAELIQFGEENDALAEKVHRLCVALLRARDMETLISALHLNLNEDFSIPHSTLRLWCKPAPPLPEFAEVSAESRGFVESLPRPYCGPAQGTPVLDWFGEDAPHLRSLAAVPLRDDASLGVLLMASEDPQRFYPEMGTLYLERIADVLSAAINRMR